MSDADCTPGREPRSVAASSNCQSPSSVTPSANTYFSTLKEFAETRTWTDFGPNSWFHQTPKQKDQPVLSNYSNRNSNKKNMKQKVTKNESIDAVQRFYVGFLFFP